MDVKTAGRVLDLFEVFAESRRPLSQSEVARRLAMPASSCFALVRTLEQRGYLYGVRPRGALYPTRRLMRIASIIQAHDPIGERIAPLLAGLAAATGETVVFAKRQGARVVYLDVVESHHPIRYMAEPGETRALHTNSIGKGLLAALPAAERDALLADATFAALTPATLTTRAALDADLARGLARGYFTNFEESIPDLCAIAVVTEIEGEPYGFSVVGPRARIAPQAAAIADRLKALQREIAPPARRRTG